MEIKEEILLSEKQLKFWEKLCEFHNKNKLNFKLNKPGDRQYFDLRINSKYHIRLSMNSLKKEFQVGFYIENDKFLYNYLLENKQEIESNFSFDLIWQNFETKKSSVIYTTINFDIDNTSEWDNYLYIILNKSQKLSEAFEKFSEIYYGTKNNSLEIREIENKISNEKEGIFKKILKKLFPFFYKIEDKQDSLKNEEKIVLEKNNDFKEEALVNSDLKQENIESSEKISEEDIKVVKIEENIRVELSAPEELKTSLEFENLRKETSEEENNIFKEESLINLESKQEDIELLEKNSEEVIVEEKDNFNPQELKEEVTEIMELQKNTEDKPFISNELEILVEAESSQEEIINTSQSESLLEQKEENVLVENNLSTEQEIRKESNDEKIVASEIETLKEKKSKIIKRKISEDLLIQNILSEEEMKIFGEKLGLILKNGNDKIKYSPKIVNFLVSVAYYEGFSDGGYWNKVFDVLGVRFIRTRYSHLTNILRETLQHKRLFIDDSTQWAYNTIIAHTIVPLKGGAFYKYLDFAYSFYDSIDSDINSISEEDLKLMVKELLEKEKDSPFILKGTKLAIENCLNMVVEYFIEILYYIDILDSQKEDFSSLGNVIKEKIKEWYDYNLSRGFSIKKNIEENFSENDKEEVISITNKIGTLKFTCDTLGVNIETPKMLFDYSIYEAYIKIGETKIMLNYKKIGNKFVVGSKKITRKSFDFKLIKLFINDKLVKEWDNKIIFFKENGKNIKPKQTKNNIYELDIRKVRILFDDSYSIFSTTKENKEISEANIIKGIKYADLNLEDIYYLKKNNEVVIIKSISKEEEPEVIVENNMIIKNILIAEKPVFNRHPQIFIPYTLPEKYKVFINDEPVEVKEGFNTINFKESGYYDIKICKGIKNTRETRVIRREKQYFYFEDLNIVFYNEDGEKEYLFSHRDKKPIGNYNFDTEGISKVVYNGKEIEKCGNTFDLYIDNGFKKEFSFQMVSEGKEYQATGKMRVLEWSLDGENYFPEYNKNLLYEDIKNKVLTIKVENLVGDVIFYDNNWEEIGKNKIEFKYFQDELEKRGKDIGIKAVFRLSSDVYTKMWIESLFKIRFKSKIKSITYDKDTKLLDVKVRGKINDMILQIKDSNDEIVYKKDKLELDNKIAIDLVGKYKVEVLLEEESFDFFAEDDGETVLYDNFLEF